MKRTRLSAAALGAALLAAVGLGPAHATGLPYNVPGTPGSYPFSASSTGTLTFATNSCTAAVMSGSSTKGTAIVDIVSITAASFTGCVGIAGASAITRVGTWTLHGTSAASAASTDIITVHVDNIVATVANRAAPHVCSYIVTGKADGTFDEATQTLTLTEDGLGGDLTISNVTGCLGQVSNGQAAPFTGSFVTSGLYIG